MVKEEVKLLVREQHERDEKTVLRRLAGIGSASAEILMGQLDVSRGALKEALGVLRDERKAQANLLEILSATRYRVITGRGLYCTKCPKKECFARDSYRHMIECYGLGSQEERGVDVVPFLVRMARATLPVGHRVVIPYPMEAKEDRGGVGVEEDDDMGIEASWGAEGGAPPRGVE